MSNDKLLITILVIVAIALSVMVLWINNERVETIRGFQQAEKAWLMERMELEDKIDEIRRGQ